MRGVVRLPAQENLGALEHEVVVEVHVSDRGRLAQTVQRLRPPARGGALLTHHTGLEERVAELPDALRKRHQAAAAQLVDPARLRLGGEQRAVLVDVRPHPRLACIALDVLGGDPAQEEAGVSPDQQIAHERADRPALRGCREEREVGAGGTSLAAALDLRRHAVVLLARRHRTLVAAHDHHPGVEVDDLHVDLLRVHEQVLGRQIAMHEPDLLEQRGALCEAQGELDLLAHPALQVGRGVLAVAERTLRVPERAQVEHQRDQLDATVDLDRREAERQREQPLRPLRIRRPLQRRVQPAHALDHRRRSASELRGVEDLDELLARGRAGLRLRQRVHSSEAAAATSPRRPEHELVADPR